MRANGYGADLELTDAAVVIHAGRTAARIQGTDTVTIPLGDVERVDYRPASALVNGSLRVVVRIHPAPPGVEAQYAAYGADPGNHVNPQSLVVHWRKRDEAAFAAIRDALERR